MRRFAQGAALVLLLSTGGVSTGCVPGSDEDPEERVAEKCDAFCVRVSGLRLRGDVLGSISEPRPDWDTPPIRIAGRATNGDADFQLILHADATDPGELGGTYRVHFETGGNSLTFDPGSGDRWTADWDEVIAVEIDDELPRIRGEFDVWAFNAEDVDQRVRFSGTFRANLTWTCWKVSADGGRHVHDAEANSEFCSEAIARAYGAHDDDAE